MMKKSTVVIHSGGMDSSICLKLAIDEYGAENVLSLSFNFSQRHSSELVQAKKICSDWKVDHTIINIECLSQITENALTNKIVKIESYKDSPPNTLVVGRNGLFARLGSIHAHHLSANSIYMGVIGVEGNFSHYRDCSRKYMDLKEQILRIDLNNPHFEIKTPLVHLTKLQTLELANRLGILKYLLENTITCYEGLSRRGCEICPACVLKNQGLDAFKSKYPDIQMF